MDTGFSSELAQQAKLFRQALLSWYQGSARVLPWRVTPSIYKTVVSEFMLQQTQVATVLPYFERWMKVYPDFAALARAPEEGVLKLWEGLGYYNRARKLHQLAQRLMGAGALSSEAEFWLQLPGVGPYTAAAITSIAFGVPIACVDGNVVRVLARLTADDRVYPSGCAAAKAFRPLAGQLLDPVAPGDYNQAMMELGATVCTPRKPRCFECPVQQFCQGARLNIQEKIPVRVPAKKYNQTCLRVYWIGEGALLLQKIASQARSLAGVWELPHLNAVPQGWQPMYQAQRTIGQRRIQESIYWVEKPFPGLMVGEGASVLAWVPFSELSSITLSGPHKRWIEEALCPLWMH